MPQSAGMPASHHLSACHLGDAGPSYAPVYLTEYGTGLGWPTAARRPLGRTKRWIVRAALVALVVCGAHFGGNAKTPRLKTVPAEISAGSGGTGVLGGREVNRW